MIGEAIRVTQLERVDPEGARPYYRARVHVNGQAGDVDSRFGSWQVSTPDGRREVLPAVAAQLQARLPADERRPRR